MQKLRIILGLMISFSTVCWAEYQVGLGLYDITGPAAGRGMMGYAQIEQETHGIHTRLYARSLVVQDSTKKTVGLVVADLGMISHLIKDEVVKILNKKLPGVFTHQNLMIGATHTHSGPGGFFHFNIYNISTLGFSENNFRVITQGIVKSLLRAHANLEPGRILLNKGRLQDVAMNRSVEAYLQNPESNQRPDQVNKEMLLLRIEDTDGRPLGLINWYALHQTSLNKHNTLISSDNKGHASFLFEQYKKGHYKKQKGFVAMFANAEEGDVSPNIFAGKLDQFKRNEVIGNRQFHKAKSLFNQAKIPLLGKIDFAHVWKKLPGLSLPSGEKLCEPAFGRSFAAGSSEDGPSEIPGFFEGMLQDNHHNDALSFLFHLTWPLLVGPGFDEGCHAPKPVMIAKVALKGDWFASTLPFQVIQIGQLAIVAAPSEMTTVAGARLKLSVLNKLKKRGVREVVIMGLANAYSGYVTSREEYQVQHYEGASTLYGPNTLRGYQFIYEQLIQSMLAGNPLASDTRPSLKIPIFDLRPGVIFDGKRPNESWGQVLLAPKKRYQQGELVVVEFRSGHAKNNQLIQSSFLNIQRLGDVGFETIAEDNHPDTKYIWSRDSYLGNCFACSRARIEWKLSSQFKPGVYRIKHTGHYKSIKDGGVYRFSNVSPSFIVE